MSFSVENAGLTLEEIRRYRVLRRGAMVLRPHLLVQQAL